MREPAFQYVDDLLYEAVVTGFDQQVESFRRQVEVFATELGEKFFKMLGTPQYMGIEESPFGDGWEELSLDWLKKKDKKFGRSMLQRFYLGLGKGGHLIKQASRVDANARFGRPIISRDGQDDPDVVRDGQGRYRFAAGTRRMVIDRQTGNLVERGVGGRYAGMSTRLTVRLFPKARGKDPDQVRAMLGQSKWAKKLAINDEVRPLFTPFFEWYTSTYVDQEIRRRF